MKEPNNKNKRILILNYEFPPLGGGAGNATYYLLKEFSKMNIEIDLVTSSTSKYKKENFSSNITLHFLDIGKNNELHYQSKKDLLKYSWKAYCYSKNLMKRKKYDLIHAFFGIPCGYVAMKLKRKFKVPYIVSLRGSDVPFYNERFKLLDKFVFRRLSKKIWRRAKDVITNSQGLKELALSASPKQRIKVIPNGVNTKEFKPGKAKNKKLTLISTGRLIERKGYQYLIPALKGLNVKLKLVGDGNLTSELKVLAKKNKVDVEFLGTVKHEEIPLFLQKADLFVLPSLNEGMSNSVLEAMSSGLPIITTDVGGSQELIKGNGFVIEKNKKTMTKNLKNTITTYKENPELIKKHSKESRKLAEKMSWTNIARQYFEEYE